MEVRFLKSVRNLQTINERSDEGGTAARTHDFRYLATGSSAQPHLFQGVLGIKRRQGLSASLVELFGILGADPGASGRFYGGGLVDRDSTEDELPRRGVEDERPGGERIVGWGLGCAGP